MFDLDGTLTDPARGITGCLRHALRELGATLPSPEALRRFIGPPLEEIFQELLEAPSGAEVERAVDLYRERYENIGLFENALIPGVTALLRGVRALDVPAYVVTSKAESPARRIVERFSLTPFFAGVIGSRPDGSLGRKHELIHRLAEREGIEQRSAVMVGDRHHDIEGAKTCRLDSIGVTWGYGSRRELEGAGARWICDKPDDLLRTLQELSGQR